MCVCVNSREHGSPGQLGVDIPSGGVQGEAGEGQGWGQAVFVAELCGGHPVVLLDLWEVGLGGHQHTGDTAVHVVLLSHEVREREGNTQRKERERDERGRKQIVGKGERERDKRSKKQMVGKRERGPREVRN